MHNKNINFKKLLCYNIVNDIKCSYKNKCMFAHNLQEQIKESIREYIYNIINDMSDLSNINIKEDKELFTELLIFTKECKNCINKKCPGGYNCKFGACSINQKICHNDLLSGKCMNTLTNEILENKIIIKRCQNGIHLTEKNLIPYYQRTSTEINMLDYSFFLFNNINYFSKINTISVMLNDETIKIVKKIINKEKINKTDINNSDYDIDDNIMDDELLKEYMMFKENNMNNIEDCLWRYNYAELLSNDIKSDEKEIETIQQDDENDKNNRIKDYNEQIKDMIDTL